MNLNLIIIVISVLIGFTVIYKLIPYRRTGEKKPVFDLLPKYRKSIHLNINQEQLESKLATFGFNKISSKNEFTYFNRGSLLGDFSIKLLKIKLGVKMPHDGLSEITLEAGWVVAFDTGNFWIFITELAGKLEKA
jgi:hypothetical protein